MPRHSINEFKLLIEKSNLANQILGSTAPVVFTGTDRTRETKISRVLYAYDPERRSIPEHIT
jgi:hypothetical protein